LTSKLIPTRKFREGFHTRLVEEGAIDPTPFNRQSVVVFAECFEEFGGERRIFSVIGDRRIAAEERAHVLLVSACDRELNERIFDHFIIDLCRAQLAPEGISGLNRQAVEAGHDNRGRIR
jgi:hypothetical protein